MRAWGLEGLKAWRPGGLKAWRPGGWKAAGALVVVAAMSATSQWATQTSGVTARLRGISAVSERVVWASGSNSTILRTIDGGATWKTIKAPVEDRLDFRDIDAIGADVAYLLSIGPGAASRIFKTTNAGAAWTQQYANTDPKVFFDAMTFWDARRGIVLSDSVDGQFYFLMTENGGTTWTRVPPASLPRALDNEGFFAASGTNVTVRGNHIWVGTGAAAKARVLHSRDRGRTWTVADTPLASGASSGIYSIAFRDDRHGVIVGGDYAKEAAAVDNVAITSDGGAKWTLIKERALSGFRSVVAPVPHTRATWIAIGPQGSDISTDDGHTWTPVPGPGFDTFSFAPGKSIGWASGARGTIAKLQMSN